MKGIALILVGVLSVGALAGCGGTRERAKPTEIQPPATVPPAIVPPAIPRCAEGESVLLGGANESLFAVVRRPTRAFRTPDDGGLIARFGVRNVNGHLTVFSVLGAVVDARCRPVWLRVELPLRPNGETGFVPAKDVNLGTVDTKIVVDLSRRLVTLYRAGKPALRARAAVGAPWTPTPTGRFYVNQRLIAPDPSGPYGPAAIGISAFSDVEQGWEQGGPIAIHGTNEPQTIGQAVSHGCIRLENAVLRRLFWAVPAGTPVVIRR